MSPRQRRWIFLAAVAGLVAFYLWGLVGLPGFGNYPGPYGDIINRIAVGQTKATGVVSAVNFEYRGFDTVGEEFILFIAATGVSTVLRQLRGDAEDLAGAAGTGPGRAAASDAIRLVALILTGPVLVMGWYLASHAQTSPSGGFQGGVVLATAFILIYLAGESLFFRRFSPVALTDAVEAVGAGGFAAIGLAVALGLPYLHELPAAGHRARRRQLVRDHRADQLLRRPGGRGRVRADRRRTARADTPGQSGPADADLPVRGGGLDPGRRPVRHRDQPAPGAPDRLPDRRAVLDLRAAARGGLPAGAVAPYFYDVPVTRPRWTRWCRRWR